MPILFELMVLMLVAYGTGLTLGWAIWGRPAQVGAAPDDGAEGKREVEE